jgi:hypothetical protein
MISEDAWLFIGTFWGLFAGTLEFYLLGNSGWLGVTSSLFSLFLFLRVPSRLWALHQSLEVP